MDSQPPPGNSPSPQLSRTRRRWRRMRRGGMRYALPWLSPGRWHKRLALVGAALLAGLIAIAFAIGAEVAIHAHAEFMQEWPLATLLVAPAGFAAMAWLAMRFFPGTEGSGIPQALAAAQSDDPAVRAQLLSFRHAIAKVVLTLGGLLSGASIGREGPSVQVGASVMHMLAGRRHTRIASSRDLITAGSGAGVAAAFNTPLGGIMFAIEEICRRRAFHANSTTLTAVIFAGLMSLAVLGNYTYFGRTPASLSWEQALWPVLACGVAGGLLGGGFARILIVSARGLPGRIGVFARSRPVSFAALCGLATGLIGLASGGLTYGTGYAESKAALEGSAELPTFFLLAKAAVVWLAFAARIPGGIFAPALAIGAGLGADIARLLPGDPDAAVLVLGMVAFLAAMTQAPITSFVIVMEMTANHQMLLPLMATALIANTVSKTVAPTPLYDALATLALRSAKARRDRALAGAQGRLKALAAPTVQEEPDAEPSAAQTADGDITTPETGAGDNVAAGAERPPSRASRNSG